MQCLNLVSAGGTVDTTGQTALIRTEVNHLNPVTASATDSVSRRRAVHLTRTVCRADWSEKSLDPGCGWNPLEGATSTFGCTHCPSCVIVSGSAVVVCEHSEQQCPADVYGHLRQTPWKQQSRCVLFDKLIYTSMMCWPAGDHAVHRFVGVDCPPARSQETHACPCKQGRSLFI